jgi:hypothetical protein
MRKDILLAGIRLLGVWQLCGAAISLGNIIGEAAGYLQTQTSANHYNILHFCIELLIGLFFISRPFNVFNLVRGLSMEEERSKENSSDQEQ